VTPPVTKLVALVPPLATGKIPVIFDEVRLKAEDERLPFPSDWTTPLPKPVTLMPELNNASELWVRVPPMPTLPVRLDNPVTLMPLLNTPKSDTDNDAPTPTLPVTTKEPPTPMLPVVVMLVNDGEATTDNALFVTVRLVPVKSVNKSPLTVKFWPVARVRPELNSPSELKVAVPPIATLPELERVLKVALPETFKPFNAPNPLIDPPTPTLPVTTKEPPTPMLPKLAVDVTWKLYAGFVVPTPTLPLLKTKKPVEALGPAWNKVNGLELPIPTLPDVETNSWFDCWVSLVPSK